MRHEMSDSFADVCRCRKNRRSCSKKKMFLKISQNSQENTCAMKLQACTFFTEHFQATAFADGFRKGEGDIFGPFGSSHIQKVYLIYKKYLSFFHHM